MMSARHIGAAVVVDSEHAGIGILTERDILDSVAAGEDPDAVVEGNDVAGLLSMRDIVRCWTSVESATAPQPQAVATSA